MVPGMAQEVLRDLAPLLAEEGIDVDNIDVPDMETLRRAMNRAVERRNLELFSPVGPPRDIAAATLRLTVQAVLDDDSVLAGILLDQVQPESPDNSVATVASSIGMSLGLLDGWLSGQDAAAPTGLAQRTRLPAGTGPVNVQPPTSSCSPARARRSGRWTNCSAAKAAFRCSRARSSPWRLSSQPGRGSQAPHRPS